MSEVDNAFLVAVGSRPTVMFCFLAPHIENFPAAFKRSVDERPGDMVEKSGSFIFLATGI